jgi:hypothetical protein
MIGRAICGLALAMLCGACSGRAPTDVREPAPHPVAIDVPSLVFPAIDSATLASLSARLERLARDSSLLSALNPDEPRMYSLFRALEAAQERFAIALTTPDATGLTLYDRLMAMTARVDSVFRALEERHRQAPRP